jgi:urease accessory protein
LQGDAFGKTTSAIWQTDLPDLTYPVAVGAAAQQMGLDVQLTAMLFLQAFASTLVSVAVRLVPLGQTEGQKVLAALTPLCQSIAEQTNGATLDALQSTAFLSDIAAMNHETLTHRIFRS